MVQRVVQLVHVAQPSGRCYSFSVRARVPLNWQGTMIGQWVRSYMRVVVKTVLLELDMKLSGWRASLFPSSSNRSRLQLVPADTN
jgi:hypothetical protein